MEDWRDDSRDFRRMSIDCQVEFRPADGGQMQTGAAKDLSATGVSFITSSPPVEGDEIEVRIDSGSSLLHAMAKVLRVSQNADNSYEVGCEILGMQ